MAKKQNYAQRLDQIRGLPQVNIKDYRTKEATIKDLQNKYGFDYSSEHAHRQAELERQRRQQGLEHQQRQLQSNFQEAATGLEHNYFQRMQQQMQNQVNTGITGGIQADQDLRLNMARQAELANLFRDRNLEEMRLADEFGRLDAEEAQRAYELQMLQAQQAFENIMQLDAGRRQENLALLDAALRQQSLGAEQYRWAQEMMQQDRQFAETMEWERYKFNNLSAYEREQVNLARNRLEEEKRQFNSEMAWRRYTFNNMSAYERATLNQRAAQHGEEMAWRMYEAEAKMKLEKAKLAAMKSQQQRSSQTSQPSPRVQGVIDNYNRQQAGLVQLPVGLRR